MSNEKRIFTFADAHHAEGWSRGGQSLPGSASPEQIEALLGAAVKERAIESWQITGSLLSADANKDSGEEKDGGSGASGSGEAKRPARKAPRL